MEGIYKLGLKNRQTREQRKLKLFFFKKQGETEKAEDKKESEKVCSLSAQEKKEQQSVGKTDSAKAEGKTATTVDNFLVLVC